MRPSRFLLLLLATLACALGWFLLTPAPQPQGGRPEEGPPAFPLLAEAPEAAAGIAVSGPEGRYRLGRSSLAGPWLLTEKGGYPAGGDAVARLLNGLSVLRLYEPKTDRPEQLGLLGLDDGGQRILVEDAAGRPLVDAVIGGLRENLARPGDAGTYLRYADSAQGWLARGALIVPKTAMALVDRQLLSLPAAVIAKVAVTPPDGAAPLVLLRPDRGGSALQLDPPAPDGAALDRAALRGMTEGLRRLTFDNLAPAGARPFAAPWRAVYTSFDGLRIALTFERRNGEFWSQIEAAAVPPPHRDAAAPRADTAAFATAMAARTKGWVFRLEPFLFSRLAQRRDDVIDSAVIDSVSE
ncbi:MAG: DUF4340 domain-containing protein [Rhodospirillales bacterium]|nr:DUF4340 domain-containing protein [Rhodospirillales bacterium]